MPDSEIMLRVREMFYVDIAKFGERYVLYIVNEATRFGAAKLLRKHPGSTPKLVPVKAHHSIGKVKRYYRPLRRAYEIVTEEHPELNNENRLQMAVKAVNDTAGPSRLIPILLVFGVYPRITELDPPNLLIERRATTIRKAIKEVRRIYTIRKVNDALGTRNGPGTTYIHNLRFNNEVIVYREKKG
ncbi:hypothetical protein DL98DRAFT_640105 [Cadophora sp. DSE1049]|nr:hypothetical protein DL98DRAFT_640105 [Cadophora sp. DSE1049]